MTRRSLLPRTLALCALLSAACGGGGTDPTPITPTPTPTPEPTPVPTPVTRCSPLPPPVTRWSVKMMYRKPDHWILDATPRVGPNVEYCHAIGFELGTSICPVRKEGDPLRAECEAYAVGLARDTGRYGPTWTRKCPGCGAPVPHLCTGVASGCANSPDNQYQVLAYENGIYEACATNGACGEFKTER